MFSSVDINGPSCTALWIVSEQPHVFPIAFQRILNIGWEVISSINNHSYLVWLKPEFRSIKVKKFGRRTASESLNSLPNASANCGVRPSSTDLRQSDMSTSLGMQLSLHLGFQSLHCLIANFIPKVEFINDKHAQCYKMWLMWHSSLKFLFSEVVSVNINP